MAMTSIGRLLAMLAFAGVFATVAATFAEEKLSDPAMERRARALMNEIRCVVCQSQSIADSDSAIAADMRQLIRERIATGQSDAQILDYLASRYGDFVRFRPPFNAATALLWIGPFIALAAALFGAYCVIRRRSAGSGERTLDEAERKRVERLLQSGIRESDREGA